MIRVEQETTYALTGLHPVQTYQIAVQIVTSNSVSPYSTDAVLVTATYGITELEQLSKDLGLPELKGRLITQNSKNTNLETQIVGLESEILVNQGKL